MCGIYGVLGVAHYPERGLAAIRRRGPDQSGRWSDGDAAIWLAHRRLSILDLSAAGAQPMHSPDGRYVLIYNGEIYNFREQRRELEAVGERFVGHSDTEVVLRLFMRGGDAALDRLNGIFALALWDRRDRRLLLARDPMGVKPLYFTLTRNGGVAFASEIKALIRAGDVEPRMDQQAALHHLGLLWSPGRRTIAAGVEKLLPGEKMWVALGTEPARSLFADPARPDPATVPFTSAEQAIAAVRDGVETAVARQLVADVPLGSFLSGGLDSSSIAAFASRHRNGPGKLQCYSIDIDTGDLGSEGFVEDLDYARKVATHIGADLHVVKAGTDMVERLPEMVYFLDEPTADFAALNTLLIAELARASGMTVLLSGAGGDDIFTGYRRHYALQQERFLELDAWQLAKCVADNIGFAAQAASLGRRIGKAFQYADRSADERLAAYFYWLDPEVAAGLFANGSEIDGAAMAGPMHESLARIPDGATALQRLLYLECRHFLADHNMNYGDKMGMAASIEIRVPLIDLELVRMAGRIPDNFKQHGRTGKWVFKRAMGGILPDEVIYRPKTGFGVPLRQWILGPLDPWVRQELSPERVAARGLFNPQRVTALVEANRAGRTDASYSILALLCLELWASQFIDGNYAVDAHLDTVAEHDVAPNQAGFA